MDVRTRFPMLRNTLLTLLGALLLVTSVHAEPVKLSVLIPLSNLHKKSGSSAKQGFLLGIQQEVEAHKVPWDDWVTLEFVDTRADAEHSLQAAKEAIAGGAKAILGCFSSKVGLKLRDYVLDEAGVPFIVFAGCVTAKLRTKHALFIRTTRSVPLFSTTIANWLKENPLSSAKKPRWACIHSDYAFGIGVCNGFKRAYGETGEEVGRVPIPLKTVNMKREIVQLAKLNPDFAVAAFASAENEVFFRDYYRFNMHEKIPIVSGSSSALSSERIKSYEKTLAAYGTGDGLITATAYLPSVDNPTNKQFVAQYQKAYKELPSFNSLWGYDAGRLLAKALIERQGKWDGAKVVELMKTLPYTSPRHGQSAKFDTHGDFINGAYIIRVKRDGNKLVREIIGQVPPINLDEMLK